MPILTVILVILLVGLVVWLINTYTPIDQKFKSLIVIFAVVCLVLWILSLMGILSSGPMVPRVH